MERKKSFHINMVKQYLERYDDQEVQYIDESQVCAVSLVDLTAEETISDGLIETLSVCESGEETQRNINPALSPEEQNQVHLLVQEFSGTFSDQRTYGPANAHLISGPTVSTNTLL